MKKTKGKRKRGKGGSTMRSGGETFIENIKKL